MSFWITHWEKNPKNYILIVLNYDPGQTIWNKLKKSTKIGQDQKTLIFALK